MSRKQKNIPFSDLLNDYYSIRPKSVESINNTSTTYYYNRLIAKLFGVFEIVGAPETWDIEYMKERLFLDGKLCITDTALGVLPLRTGVSGINVYDKPQKCIIANVLLGNLERTIGEDCALVHLQYNYAGVWDILNRYATMLSLCDAGVCVNLMNTKVSVIFGAETKVEAESFKALYDEITAGNPAVFTSDNIVSKLRDKVVFADSKNQFIAPDIQYLKQSIMDDFLTEIGVDNANTDKRERLIKSEVMSNRAEVRSAATHWLDTVNDGLEVANRLYNMKVSMRLRSWDFKEGGDKVDASEFA